METKVNYTIVGIFVLLLLAAIVVVTVWLSAGLNYKNYKNYLVYMNESVAGLSIDSPVKYNGVTVGQVSDIQLNLKNPQQVILTLEIQPHIPITETTYAVLMEQGITGIAFVGLKTGEPAPLLIARNGEKYPVIPSQPSFLMMLNQTVERMSDNFNDLSNSVKNLLNKRNLLNLQDILINIRKITGNIAENSNNISSTLTNLKTVMQNTANASKEFPSIMNSVNNGSKSIQNLSAELSQTTKAINQTVEQSNVAITSFSNDILPQTYSTLKEIKRASQSINGLSTELKQNPAMIIKGKALAQPGPGE